jgi:hypothetical protein
MPLLEEEKNSSPKPPTCKVCGKELVEAKIPTVTYHPRTNGMDGDAKVLKCPDCGLLYAPSA